MNRAWIPAGALAGVSVAGLIALGPLTDSLNTHVPFPTSISPAVGTSPSKARATVPVSITIKHAVGNTVTAALPVRGGASSAVLSTSGDAGQVALHINSKPSGSGTTSSQTATRTTPPAAATKKAPKRQTSIGTIGEPNGDAGLAGGSKGSTSLGEQSSTPAP